MTTNLEPRTVDIETSLGVVPVTGVFGDKLSILAITGAFAEPEEMSRTPIVFAPEFDGYVAKLPGNGTPELSETSIPAFARAFDEVLETLGPTVVVGVSAGGLVSLAMRSPLLRAIVAVEPPIATAKLWPLFDVFRKSLGGRHDTFVRNVFGIHEDRVDERDYGSLLPGVTVPLEVLLGSEPLFPVREVSRFPSLVDEPERQLLAKYAHISIAMNTGHAVPYFAGRSMLGVIQRVCRQVAAAS